jgi:hypothetical protein
VGALPGELEGVRTADAAAGAGHDRDAAFEEVISGVGTHCCSFDELTFRR